MRRILLLLSALGLVTLALGTTYAPNDPTFWLAASTPVYQIVRGALAIVLFVQFVTHPPRHILFRLLCGLISVSAGIWAIQETNAYHMMALDTLSIMAASIATGITALELSSPKEVTIKTPRGGYITY